MARVMIVGAGIAGLTMAYGLRWRQSELPSGMELDVHEAQAKVGGGVFTEVIGGAMVEGGPNGFPVNTPWTLATVQRLGLSDSVRRAPAASTAMSLFRSGALRPFPQGARGLLGDPALGTRARLRILREPVCPPAPTGVDETVGAFFRRHLGDEAGNLLAGALCRAHWAADADTLSMQSAFPAVVQEVQEAGGLLRASLVKEGGQDDDGVTQRGFKIIDEIVGLLAANTAEAGMRRFEGSATGPSAGLASLEGGMGTFPRALAAALGERVKTRSEIKHIEGHAPGRSSGPYRVTVATPDGEAEHVVDGLALTISAEDAAALLRPLDAELAAALGSIPHTDLTEVVAIWPQAAAPQLAGAGYVVAPGSDLHHLRASWTAHSFPSEGPVAARLVFGGAGDADIHARSDDELRELAARELKQTIGGPAPSSLHIRRRHRRVPLYTPGHKARLASVMARLTLHPALVLTGAAFDGTGLGDILRHVAAAADQLVLSLRHGEGRKTDGPAPRRG